LTAALSLVSGIGIIARPAVTAGYLAAMGQPFPTTAFVVAVVIALGGNSRRACSVFAREGPRWHRPCFLSPQDWCSILPRSVRTSRFSAFDAYRQEDRDALTDYRGTRTGNMPKTRNDFDVGSLARSAAKAGDGPRHRLIQVRSVHAMTVHTI
jgi:hypothetical protein